MSAALGMAARLERARLLLARGSDQADRDRACRVIRRVVELWDDVEEMFAPAAVAADSLAEVCAS